MRIIAFMLLAFVLILAVCGCASGNSIRHIGSITELDMRGCTMEHEEDSHGGFLGDGEYFARVNCTDEADRTIKNEWDPLPLPREIQEAMDIISYYGNGGGTVFERFGIPRDINGYYRFLDRHSEAINRRSAAGLNRRSSYNYSIAIYDSDAGILYFYELDT